MYSYLMSPTEARTPALLDFCSEKRGRSHEGVRRRLFEFFVLDQGGGGFLDHTTVVAQAQDGLSPELIAGADYLPAGYGPPIFSARFAEATAAALSEELRCYPCVVRCHDREFDDFVVAKTLRYLPLVDPERSTYRRVGTDMLLRQPVYRPELADQFFLARDTEHRGHLVCGPRLATLVETARLRVLFRPTGATSRR